MTTIITWIVILAITQVLTLLHISKLVAILNAKIEGIISGVNNANKAIANDINAVEADLRIMRNEFGQIVKSVPHLQGKLDKLQNRVVSDDQSNLKIFSNITDAIDLLKKYLGVEYVEENIHTEGFRR